MEENDMLRANGLEAASVQWFPGHMAKTRRLIKENLRMVDAVVEILDARIPRSSRNPEIDSLAGGKPRLLLLNKCDLADPDATSRWCAALRGSGAEALAVDCRSGKGLQGFLPAVKNLLKVELERREQKGMGGRPIRIMTVGVPNVGKSSLINRLAGSRRAKVEDRPGVTRGKQWVNLGGGVELLDMPGVLWPKFEDPLVGENLAYTGAVKDEVVDQEWLAMRLLGYLNREYRPLLAARYRLDEPVLEGLDGGELLNLVARKRGMLVSGGEADTTRAAAVVMDEFRGGKIGRISLEKPAG